MKVKKLSVIIPTFNGSAWLPITIPIVDEQLINSNLEEAEILVIDDGSTDDTVEVVKTIKTKTKLRIVSQQNQGRFMARRKGALESKFENLLYIDTRIELGKGSLDFLLNNVDLDNRNSLVWCSHVLINKKGNVYARFWDAIARVVWRKYFKNPKRTSYGAKEFDFYPKGTTCFFITKKILSAANSWFINNTRDLKKSNDDTLLLKYISEKNNINLDPRFSCTYNARSNLKQFIRHSYHRGSVFVDGFFRLDGNIYLPIALLILIALLTAPVIMLFFPGLIPPIIYTAIFIWFSELAIALISGVDGRDSLALFILTPIFTLFYASGIIRALSKQFFYPGLIKERR